MTTVLHSSLTGTELHESFHYVQTSDPGAVGAGKYWLDTTTSPYVLKRRNAGDSAWVTVGASSGAIGVQTTIGADLTNTRGTAVVSAGSANVKGSWTQLVASTAAVTNCLVIYAYGASSAQRYLLDIGIGGAGSETVLIPNLHAGGNALAFPNIWRIPINVPAGTRISARIQAGPSTSRTLYVMAILDSGSKSLYPVPTQCATYGANTADSGLTSIDPGASAATEGAWTEITASTGFDATWMCVTVGNDITNLTGTASWFIDIGTGAAASEVAIINELWMQSTSVTDLATPGTFWFPVSIPSGTRLSARCRCSVNTATERLLDIGITIAG